MTADLATMAVVYLARHAEGTAALRRFADSYRTHPAGCDHQLVVLYKGYLEQSALIEARRIFDDLPHVGLELDDSGFDIGSYVEAAHRLSHVYLCPVNTFTEIAAPGWLALLAKRATAPAVGLAGAMGSYESMYCTQRLYNKAHWLRSREGAAHDPALHHYYRDFLGERALPACAHPRRAGHPRARWFDVRARVDRLMLDARFRPHWKRVMAAREPVDVTRYPRFPNPHVRTTGFMIRRERLLAFDRDQFRSKGDVFAFESGFDGLTIQLRRAGLAALVIGKDDRDFDVADWPRSGTFRLGDQGNLLVTDGLSRKFDRLDSGSRVTGTRFTWGDYAGAPPDDYPDLGQRFPRGALTPP